MSTLLDRMGRAAFRHRTLFSAAWVAVLAAVIALFVIIGGQFDDEFTIPGSESQAALDQLDAASPAAAGASAQLVFLAPDGATVTDPRYAQAIEQVVGAAGQVDQVAAVQDPFAVRAVSADGRAALASVQYTVPAEQLGK